ncbi:hypothetical protein COCSUDRAFT_58365 [Coccomyxa subellipsoidea C-169]|uniref:Uncharacterized protein n=1 Tax=Coccomyxa subellipsoidea (strain C-169) TaxID=574566 RepID=I0YMK0_COCSC|nr:hypothetical protein COCSUDRAFT_58365 [Coccomyxa subellipsoidea C-169]EIE19619.1 hypothetical protein COCSUDRAFT_58365 [Coccomyxa subellipsoidea C-169]|eukprot:XP_005644163.1 hypothetical protein COCSUDRAFT_58365 [Coccomyxa subellipsoidea C-169]
MAARGWLGVSDENCSPNESRSRETTPDIFDIGVLTSSSESPYSPRSNPFGKRPSQRTPGALAFVRRLSELSTPEGEAKLDTMRQGHEGKEPWQPSPEVSAEALQSSWDAVGRIDELVGEQVGNSGQSPLPKLPNLATVQEASHLAELAESELALTWTGSRVKTEEGSASWRKRISNPTFHGSPSPTSSRASSASEPLLNAAGYSGSVRAPRGGGGSPAAVDSGVSSPFRTPRAAAGQPPVTPPTEDALRSSAELFPRSFRIQRSGSSDSLASLLSMTSDITVRESSFEGTREGTALETILEPGETPERREDRTYFGRTNVLGNPAQLVLGDVPPAAQPGGPETPRTQVLRVEGAFASPIEVQAAQGPRVEPPLYLDAATASQELLYSGVSLIFPRPAVLGGPKEANKADASAASAWLQRQGAATPYAQLSQPSSLTPVIRRARAAHAEASTREQRGSGRGPALAWSTALLVLQLLLILAPFVLILTMPALLPTLPNLGSHPTTSSKAASLSSAATFPGVTAGRSAGAAWWTKPWTSTASLFSRSSKAPSGPVDTAADFLHRLFRQETPQGTHAFFGLLPRASATTPTPHLDKLLSRAADWWSGISGRLRPATAAGKPPRKLPPPRGAAVDAGLKPAAAAERKTPAQRSLQRAQDLKPKVSVSAPAAHAPAQPPPPPPAVPKQARPHVLFHRIAVPAKPQAPPAAAPKQAPPASKPAQPSAPPQVQPHVVKSKPIVEPKSSRAGSGKSTLQGLGARVRTSTRRLTASAEKAVKALKRDAADAAEGMLLRGRALLPRNLPSLPRALQAHGQGITAAAAIATLIGILAALITSVVRGAPAQQEPLDGVPAPATPAGSVPSAVAPGREAPRTTSRRVRRAAAEEGPVSPRRGLRQPVPAASMPPPATPRPTAGRAARTAPVSAEDSRTYTPCSQLRETPVPPAWGP